MLHLWTNGFCALTKIEVARGNVSSAPARSHHQPTQATRARALLLGLQPLGPLHRSSSAPFCTPFSPRILRPQSNKTGVTFRIISIALWEKLFFFNLLNIIFGILSLEKTFLCFKKQLINELF